VIAELMQCQVIIQVVCSLFSLYPAVVIRHWFFWVSGTTFRQTNEALPKMPNHDQYHVFNSAVCVGTLVLHNPQNVLASFALSQIDAAIALFSSAVQMHASPRAVGNLQWLLRLRSRAVSKMHAASNEDVGRAMDPEQSDSDEDVELLGWRTRLIERAAAGAQTAKTIQSEGALPHSRSNRAPPSTAPYPNVLQQSSIVDFSDIFGIPTTNSHASADTDTLVRLNTPRGYCTVVDDADPAVVTRVLGSHAFCSGHDYRCRVGGACSLTRASDSPAARPLTSLRQPQTGGISAILDDTRWQLRNIGRIVMNMTRARETYERIQSINVWIEQCTFWSAVLCRRSGMV
jgi:hypothetical protein